MLSPILWLVGPDAKLVISLVYNDITRSSRTADKNGTTSRLTNEDSPQPIFYKSAGEHLSFTTFPRSFCHDEGLIERLFTLNSIFLQKLLKIDIANYK